MEAFLNKKTFLKIVGGLGMVLFLWLGSVLPRTTSEVFASPDETAAFTFARNWTAEYGFRLPHNPPPSVQDIASLHPRSMVRQGQWLVPVGFLGMPIIAAIAEVMWSGSSAYLTLILVASSAYPLWKLAERYSRRVAFVTIATYLTFPTVLLYVNRGLFPNLPVVALGLWAVWGIKGQGSRVKGLEGTPNPLPLAPSPYSLIVSGLCLGLALMIRPIEAIWLLPWALWAFFQEKNWKRFWTVSIIAVMICFVAAWSANQTYGKLTVGYWLRDDAGVAAMTAPVTPSVPGSSSVLPFGIHPRAAWQNMRDYVFGLFGPWVAAAALGVAWSLKQGWKREGWMLAAVGAWTAGILLLLYGQSQYLDNIRGTATIGNSFVRYLLPLVPFMAFGIGLLVDGLRTMKRRGRVTGIVCVIFLCGLGITTAYTKDEEGILRTQYELTRYAEINTAARNIVPAGSVIVSERSDKIFAGLPVVTVSPLPSREILERLVQSGRSIYLFHRTLLRSEDAPVQTVGFIDPVLMPVFTVNNESLYLLNAEGASPHE